MGIISDNAALHGHRGAHKFIVWGALVAMVVRFAVRFAGRRGADRSIGILMDASHRTADDS